MLRPVNIYFRPSLVIVQGKKLNQLSLSLLIMVYLKKKQHRYLELMLCITTTTLSRRLTCHLSNDSTIRMHINKRILVRHFCYQGDVLETSGAVRRYLLYCSSLTVVSFRIQRVKILTPSPWLEITLFYWTEDSLFCHGTGFYSHHLCCRFI